MASAEGVALAIVICAVGARALGDRKLFKPDADNNQKPRDVDLSARGHVVPGQTWLPRWPSGPSRGRWAPLRASCAPVSKTLGLGHPRAPF